MNWFKKQIDKIINRDEYEYEYEDDYDYENYQEQQVQQQPTETSATKQKAFRFPLIEDEEIEPLTESKEMFIQNDDNYYGQIEDLSLPKHLHNHIVDSRVYDVEVSGIRELLENRTKRTGRKTITRSQPEQENRSKARMVFRDAQYEPVTQKEATPKKEPIVDSSLPQNRKRFVPTDVPSPVYGFAKPSPIEQLLNKRKEENDSEIPSIPVSVKEATTNEALENILVGKVPSLTQQDEINQAKEPNVIEATAQPPITFDEAQFEEQQPVTFDEVQDEKQQPITFDEVQVEEQQPIIFDEVQVDEITQTNDLANTAVPQTSSFAVGFEEQVKEAVQQELALDQLSANESDIHVKEVIVEQVQIENSTIHIGEVTVVQPTTDEEIEQEGLDEQADKATIKQEKSRIPFNVLMLKTDKEKWQNRQQLKVTPSFISDETHKTEPIVESTESIRNNKIVESTELIPNNKIVESTDPIPNNEIVKSTEEESAHTTSFVVKETELPLPNKESANPTLEDVAEITMSPVATMIRPSSVENTAMVVEGSDEISATTFMDTEVIVDQALVEEKIDVAGVTGNSEVVEEDLQEQCQIAATLSEKEEPIVTTPKPVKVYHKPGEEFLEPPEEKTQDTEWMEQQGDTLVEALSYFQVSAQIESIMQGPAVTQFEITVSHGTKVSKIRNLADDLKLALAAKDIRIQAPIPGKSSIGIEIPNRVSRAVRLSEVTNSASFLESDSPLEAALGLDLTGKPVTIDLRKMPHGLIAGATGSGKSVCINSILVSLLYKAAPHELKLMLIDPKMVELAPFNHIPHLVSPVITDVKAATAALKWAVEEMERRYQLFAHAGARDITRYNALADKNNEHSLKLPYILIVIDELADLMMMSPADVEEAICRIAQKARACGIHLIVATQRPSVDVITGLIKSNIPTRIAFAVSSQIDSRTILDGQGAERLLGRGDMLYLGNGMSAPVRLQGTFVTDDEIEAIIDHVREQGEPDYIFDQEELLKKIEVSAEQDDLFEDVCRFVYEQGGASTSLIQRKYHIGYNRAARLIDMLESHGFVSEARGSKPRESYITEQDLIAMFE
ncbi:DNA translocase FtsK [Lysinibacillus parviboronicapiens]|uniref:DNA translocase FtsK n=1 Tax=Lysinibacillus parviboronicapiens TaxID=436516 RepID=UPI000D3C9793|nr:DNA translocase FtsK [Lysinibacillus parviboronicapiens]